MPVYSHSSLQCFENCPLSYKYHYIDRIKTEEGETIEVFMGSRVHQVLKRLYDDLYYEKHNSLEELLAYYDECWQKHWSDDIRIIKERYSAENYKRVGERCIRDYYARYQPFDQGRTVATELPVTITLEEVDYELRGTIDRLTAFPEGRYEIHDYKTSRYLKPQADLDTDRQLALYQLGIQQRWRDVERVDLVWHYLAFDKEFRSERTGEQLARLKEAALSLIQRIERAQEQDSFPVRRGPLCDWCEFQIICPEWKHLYKVEPLPPNEYLKEPGVTLVNRWAQLEQERLEFEARYEEERRKLEDAIVAFMKREGLSCIYGSDKKLRVKLARYWRFPKLKEPGREELEKLVRKTGRWDEVSMLDSWALERVAREQAWPSELLEKLKRYRRLEESRQFYLSDLRKGKD